MVANVVLGGGGELSRRRARWDRGQGIGLGVGEVPAAELRAAALPLAHEGLDRWGIDTADRDRLLGIIERRCATQRNGPPGRAKRFTGCTRTARSSAWRPYAR